MENQVGGIRATGVVGYTSRRERIATAALQGLLARVDLDHPKAAVCTAVAYADALIAELDKDGED